MANRPLIKDSLAVLNIFGCDPNNCNRWSIIRIALSQTLYAVLWGELALECIFNWQGLESIELVGLVIALYQVMVKHSVTIINRSQFIKVLNNMDHFWPSNKYGTVLETEIQTKYALIKKCGICLLGFLVLSSLMYFIKPIISTEKTLPYETYHPTDNSKTPDYELMYILQFFTCFAAVSCVVGSDGLFVALVTHIKYELKFIREGFLEISKNDCEINYLELTHLIDHHSLVLECIKILDEVYRSMLLAVFSTNMFVICTSLFCISADGMPPSWNILSQFGSFIIVNVGQLFFYCLSGSDLITESESVSQAVYEAGWWLTAQPKVRRAYVLIIQRANKVEKLTAGGMYDLNLESFADILNNALSFFTFLQAVYNPDDK